MPSDEKTEQYWLTRLCDRNPEGRVLAAKYFWGQKSHSPAVRQALLGTLQDQDPMVREWGIMALTQVSGPPGSLRTKLIDLLNDPRGDVRWNTVAIIEKLNISTPDIVDQLVAMREDEDPIVRRFVDRALRRLKRRPGRTGGLEEKKEKDEEQQQSQLPLFEITWLERFESKEERIAQVFREVIAERTEDEQLQQLVAGRLGLSSDQAARLVDTIVSEATRVIRDREVIKQAIQERGTRCQIADCGFTFATKSGHYAEGRYIPPPDRTPRRSERPSYVLILCPNHYKMMEHAQTRKLYWDEEGRRLIAVTLNNKRFAITW